MSSASRASFSFSSSDSRSAISRAWTKNSYFPTCGEMKNRLGDSITFITVPLRPDLLMLCSLIDTFECPGKIYKEFHPFLLRGISGCTRACVSMCESCERLAGTQVLLDQICHTDISLLLRRWGQQMKQQRPNSDANICWTERQTCSASAIT